MSTSDDTIVQPSYHQNVFTACPVHVGFVAVYHRDSFKGYWELTVKSVRYFPNLEYAAIGDYIVRGIAMVDGHSVEIVCNFSPSDYFRFTRVPQSRIQFHFELSVGEGIPRSWILPAIEGNAT